MTIRLLILCMCLGMIIASCRKGSPERDVLPDVRAGAQALSLRGEPLYSSSPTDKIMAELEEAKNNYKADPANAENIIWFGRRTAYAGDYREAIRIFSKGIHAFSDDARFYRHRGHRYISIREFDRAIHDLEKAAILIEGKEDTVELDGMPNPMNIPVSTLHTNIWYHLGLAYYLKHDLNNALRAYRRGIEASTNDDMLVATTHWLYMTLRLLKMEDDADAVLHPIHKEMNVIENQVYHRLCLFYKGELPLENLRGEELSDTVNDAAAYGLGNWYFYNGQRDRARKVFEQIFMNKTWASFGYIAAEAEFVREFNDSKKSSDDLGFSP